MPHAPSEATEVKVVREPRKTESPDTVSEPPKPAEAEIKTVSEETPAEQSSDTPLLGDVPPDPVKEKDSGKALRSSRKNEGKDADGEDDLGIIQPEFGF